MNKFKLMLLASLVVAPSITFAGGYGMADYDYSNATGSLSAEDILNMSSEAETPTPYIESAQPVNTVSSRRGGQTSYYRYASQPQTRTARRGGLGYSAYYQRDVPTYRKYSNSDAYKKYLEERQSVLEGDIDYRYYQK